MEEAQGMRQRRSPGTGRRYALAMICGVYRLARSSAVSDADLVTEIRAVLAACPFHGEVDLPRFRRHRG